MKLLIVAHLCSRKPDTICRMVIVRPNFVAWRARKSRLRDFFSFRAASGCCFRCADEICSPPFRFSQEEPFLCNTKLRCVSLPAIDEIYSTMIRACRFGNIAARRTSLSRRCFSSTPPPPPPPPARPATQTYGIGSGKAFPGVYMKDRGPVSWPSLFLVGIAAASIVAYYNIERERRLESAMGRVVSSESDGWSPNPDVMAPRKFKLTKWGWFPEDDGFGPCKSGIVPAHHDFRHISSSQRNPATPFLKGQ